MVLFSVRLAKAANAFDSVTYLATIVQTGTHKRPHQGRERPHIWRAQHGQILVLLGRGHSLPWWDVRAPEKGRKRTGCAPEVPYAKTTAITSSLGA